MSIQQIVFETISEESRNDYPVDQITVDDSFEKVGLDSLSVVTVVIYLEDKLGIEVTEKELPTVTNVKKLVELCESKHDSRQSVS